jgi:hypothetical protein
VQPLLDLTSKYRLVMVLLKDLPTLQSTVSKNYTQPDNVFVSSTLAKSLTSCTMIPEAHPPCTNHLPIQTILTTAVHQLQVLTRWDWRLGDWDEYRNKLEEALQTVLRDGSLQDLAQIDARVAEIKEQIWQAVENLVPVIWVSPYSKCWWTESLTGLHKEVCILARQSYRTWEFPELKVH